MIGRRLSHYRIEESLGAGGMGRVYRARDELLPRDVAIKILPEHSLDDEGARKRFQREAFALSSLSHPHIATLFEYNSEGGVDFLVMEHVAGESLAARIARGRTDGRAAAAVAAQIADALAAAHERGVVHRDLKPANVMLTPDGRVKVLDFGLAKLLPGALSGPALTLTQRFAVAGTLPYMAPEQLLGAEVDARTDLYALGNLLYEMTTGRLPFLQPVPTALVYEIIHQPPEPPRQAAAEIPGELEGVILRCLEKSPEARHASARELETELRRIAAGETAHAPAPAPAPARAPSRAALPRPKAREGRPRLRRGALALAGVAAAVAVALGWIYLPRLAGPRIRSLAVLPLANLSRDPQQEYFADGMTDELITSLGRIAALKVISRGSVMGYRDSRKSARQIGRELGVDGLLEGTVQRYGNQVRVGARLVDAREDRQLWSEVYERDIKDLLKLQDELSSDITGKIRVALTSGERTRLQQSRAVNPDAHDAYLRGRYFWSKESEADWNKALGFFRRAIEIDPAYAPAYAGLGNAYTGLSSVYMPALEAMPKARAAAGKALEIDPDLAEGHEVQGYVLAFFDWRWPEAESDFRRAIALQPSDAVAHQYYAYFLFCQGRFPESSAEADRARDLDPLSVYAAVVSLWPLYNGRRYDETIARARAFLRDFPESAGIHFVLGQAAMHKGDFATAQAEIARGGGPNPYGQAWLGRLYARTGRQKEARAILERLARPKPGDRAPSYGLAGICLDLGDRDAALRWLERGVQEKDEEVARLMVDPDFDALREERRFQQLVKRIFPGGPAPGKRNAT